MGLLTFNNTRGGKPLPPMSLFGEAILLLGSCNPIHLKNPKWTTTPKIMAMVQNWTKGTQICSSFLHVYHPVRMGFYHFEAHTSITQRAPRSHHTKVLSKGPGGFCHIRGTKALTTTTTCSTQLRPKPGERWEEMKGKTMFFLQNFGGLFGGILFFPSIMKVEISTSKSFPS